MDWETVDGFVDGLGRSCALVALAEMTWGLACGSAGLACVGGLIGSVLCLLETLWFWVW